MSIEKRRNENIKMVIMPETLLVMHPTPLFIWSHIKKEENKILCL